MKKSERNAVSEKLSNLMIDLMKEQSSVEESLKLSKEVKMKWKEVCER